MPEKITGDENLFKELGSLQEKVLFFLAENSENHKQAIQQGTNHPADQYGSISKAVDALDKSGFIRSKTAKSQKKVEIRLYSCTEEGILYSLAKNPSANIPKVLSACKDAEFCKQFSALYAVWGHDHFRMFLNDIGEFLPMIHNKGLEYAYPYLIMKMARQLQSIDPKTRKKNVKAAIQQFPKAKDMVKEMQDNLKDLV